MDKRTFTLIAVSLIFVFIILAVFVGGRLAGNRPDPQELFDRVENPPRTPSFEVPSGSPLDEIVPETNPAEEANPFRDVYSNPFE